MESSYVLFEGEKRDVGFTVTRVRGSGSFTLSTPQRRILSSDRVLVTGFDWAAATWDDTAKTITTLFDSTATGLTTPGSYIVQFKGTIGVEIYADELIVYVKEWGP